VAGGGVLAVEEGNWEPGGLAAGSGTGEREAESPQPRAGEEASAARAGIKNPGQADRG
jgi:hypothetical protein